MVEGTPHDLLPTEIDKILKQANLKVKVKQRPGNKVKDLLCRSNPFNSVKCFDTECKVCVLKPGLCKKRETVYSIECHGCSGDYKDIGESSRSLGERFGEHLTGFRKQSPTSVFHNHKIDFHNGNDIELRLKVLSSHRGDPMRRQVSEGVNIAELQPKLNQKEEWSTGRILHMNNRK